MKPIDHQTAAPFAVSSRGITEIHDNLEPTQYISVAHSFVHIFSAELQKIFLKEGALPCQGDDQQQGEGSSA